MTFWQKNWPIIIALALPGLLILGVVAATYLPSLAVSTKYNFMYSSCTSGRGYYDCAFYLGKRFSVIDGRLSINPIDPNQDLNKDGRPDMNSIQDLRVFLYDTESNTSREITIEEAKALTLNPLLTSPDGVTVSSLREREPEFFFFGGSSSRDWYLTKGKGKVKLNAVQASVDYYGWENFNFIGWVLPGRN